jgi:hypothetical protein
MDDGFDLRQVIENREIITFEYDGLSRRAQPATYGVNAKGNIVLRACLVAGQSRTRELPCWELYSVSKMVNTQGTNEHFTDFMVPGYTRGDSQIQTIWAEH